MNFKNFNSKKVAAVAADQAKKAMRVVGILCTVGLGIAIVGINCAVVGVKEVYKKKN